MLGARLRIARTGVHWLLLFALTVFGGTTVFLLWQTFRAVTTQLHPLDSTTAIRATSAEVRSRDTNIRDENMRLKQRIHELDERLLAVQQSEIPKGGATHNATSADRHVPWTPGTERDEASSNPELADVLKLISINNEVAVAVSNKFLAADGYMLEGWCGFRFMHYAIFQHMESEIFRNAFLRILGS